ncbi:MAG: cryptochrome/photolyase family protein [Pseudomonadota bacterium]
MTHSACRQLILILGDQLDPCHPALASGDPAHDRIVMIETAAEATHVPSHPQRTALFLAAMRHYAEERRTAGWQVDYTALEAGATSLGTGLATAIGRHQPESVCCVRPGDWRVLEQIKNACSSAKVTLTRIPDTHFFVSVDAFAAWAKGRKSLTMEFFYREQRKRYGILMDGKEPAGGAWNYDKDNRKAFGKRGPGMLPPLPHFAPDAITQAVLDEVQERFADHAGRLDGFGWPVTRAEALVALARFIEERLPLYGQYQDAMWQGEPFLYHALLGSSMNLKLLNPREVVAAAVAAWQQYPERYPLSAVEGFVRQILGWREFIRGIYWHEMPTYKARNHYDHQLPLPAWFWTGKTRMNCLSQCITDTLENAYAHHIQRLMIIGNYATLAGIAPQAVCDWFLSVYVDAVEWVELPNVLGMALHGDGGIVGSKPYVASAGYINRMSNYCAGCSYDPKARSTDNACPFNALYWDFLARHRAALASSPRMRMVLKNLDRWEGEELAAIQQRAAQHRATLPEQ